MNLVSDLQNMELCVEPKSKRCAEYNLASAAFVIGAGSGHLGAVKNIISMKLYLHL